MDEHTVASHQTRRPASLHRLHPLHAGWVVIESPSNLMHGGILCIFDTPQSTDQSFVDQLVDEMRRRTTPNAPFDRRLKWFARVVPLWEVVERFDPNHHLFRHTLAAPGDDVELNHLVSQLQSTPLDHGRPLWSFHIIDGLADRRFAIYGKMHHALADGVSALSMVNAWLSDKPTDRTNPAMWAVPPQSRRERRPPERRDDSATAPQPSSGRAWPPIKGIKQLLTGTIGAAVKATTGVAARPWSAPRSALNTPISPQRLVVTQTFNLSRFQNLAKLAGGTVNDVVLAMCAGALRHYLSELDMLPKKSLVTSIPVSLRSRADGLKASNAISWAMLPLATDISDVRERFDIIRAASARAKAELAGLSSINTYTLMVVAPILIEQLAGLGGRVRPMFNVPISNVPGPPHGKYLNGAVLREIYALTVLYGGQALNVVAVSHAGQLNLTFTGCKTTLPDLRLLASYSDSALTGLETEFGAPHNASDTSAKTPTEPTRRKTPHR